MSGAYLECSKKDDVGTPPKAPIGVPAAKEFLFSALPSLALQKMLRDARMAGPVKLRCGICLASER